MAFVVIVAVALLSQGANSASPRKASTKQYTVKKSRDTAQGMASSDRKVDRAPGGAPTTQPVRSLTPDAESKATQIQIPADSDESSDQNTTEQKADPGISAIIAEAYSADTTQLALDLLAQELARAQESEDTSKLYSAIGSLQLSQADPDTEAGLAALRQATESATTPEMRSKAAITEASALVLHADSADGLTRIDEMLDDDGIDGLGAHHLTLLRGDLLVEQGDLRAAESEYENVRRAVTPVDTLSSKPSDALFRQASLRLDRLYTRTGDEKKEAIIARDLEQATMR